MSGGGFEADFGLPNPKLPVVVGTGPRGDVARFEPSLGWRPSRLPCQFAAIRLLKDSAFTRRLSQTTACTSKELFLKSLSCSLPTIRAGGAGGAELCPGRAGDLRGRRDGVTPPEQQRNSQRAVCAYHCSTAQVASQLEAPSRRRAAAPPSTPGRTASAAPADAPKGRRLERPALAACGDAVRR